MKLTDCTLKFSQLKLFKRNNRLHFNPTFIFHGFFLHQSLWRMKRTAFKAQALFLVTWKTPCIGFLSCHTFISATITSCFSTYRFHFTFFPIFFFPRYHLCMEYRSVSIVTGVKGSTWIITYKCDLGNCNRPHCQRERFVVKFTV